LLRSEIIFPSDSCVSVAVAWEKLKGNSDAGAGEMSMQDVSRSAAAVALPAASSLESPLPSVVASQTDFIKQTLRANNAHVGFVAAPNYSIPLVQ
jgi:hypothetical protein